MILSSDILYLYDGKCRRDISPMAFDAMEKFQETCEIIDRPSLVCLCGNNGGILISETDKYGFRMDFKLCNKCSLLRIDPYFSSEALSKLYGSIYRAIKDESPESLFRRQQAKAIAIKKLINNFSKNLNFSQVVEIGCGAGGILAEFEKDGFKVVGFDLDPDFIKYGVSKGIDLRCENAMTSIGKITSERPTLVIINHVLEHILDVDVFFKQLYEKVSTDTIFYLSVPGILEYPTIHFPNNLIKLFMFAHPWNFNLTTFKYFLLNGLSGEILLEDESINLLVKKTNASFNLKIPSEQDFKVTLRYLKKMRKREKLKNFLYPLSKIKHSIMSIFKTLRC